MSTLSQLAIASHESVHYDLHNKISLLVFQSSDEALLADWNDLSGMSAWLRTPWLKAFAPQEKGGAGGPSTVYLQFLDRQIVIGQALLQALPVANMQLGRHVNAHLAGIIFGETAYQFGQVLFSGPGGIHFLPGYDATQLLSEALEVLIKSEPYQKSATWLIKDLPETPSEVPTRWLALNALPEMAMSIDIHWKSFADYLAALPSKYRTRAKRARSKFGNLHKRILSAEEAKIHYSDSKPSSRGINELYQELLDRADYVPFRGPDYYVCRLKACRPDHVALLGYFDGAKLVGFATLLHDDSETLAHLSAVDPTYNDSHQLYLNMLYDLLELSIEAEAKNINFGRTATTIKSSLGATPGQYHSFVSHSGCIRHMLLNKLSERVINKADEAAIIQRPLG